MINKKLIGISVFILIFFFVFSLFLMNYRHKDTAVMIMGGKLTIQTACEDNNDTAVNPVDVEKYLRPSSMPVLNDRFTLRFFDQYYEKKASEIRISDNLLATPEETILNYFSILRDAANHEKDKWAGCGTIGYSTLPYPVAYNFLASSYQEKLSYEEYLDSFLNILHTSLIKYRQIPVFDNSDKVIRYFVEIETIEGSEKHMGNFAYYYGFVDIKKENKGYKITNLEFHGENYLCAPMHGWDYDAEASVQIRYGGWCSLIKEMYPTIQKGFIKNISFQGTDGNDYVIVFYQLTNDTDIEISQYIKSMDGCWKLINFDPENCLKDKSK